MKAQKRGRIAFVVDSRLSREKSALLNKMIIALRQRFHIDLLGGDCSEEELLSKLETQNYDLVLAPWYRYLNWSRVEAFYGLTRNSGPTFAGYFSEPLLPYELGQPPNYYRMILLDFCHLHPQEILILLDSLAQDTQRLGLDPLFSPNSFLQSEIWQDHVQPGKKVDLFSLLPETSPEWASRLASIRISALALWSLIYEQGPGKAGLPRKPEGVSMERARLYWAMDAEHLALRLIYQAPHLTPKDLLQSFWPAQENLPDLPQSLLRRHADWIRAHLLQEENQVELVIGFFKSAPSQKAAEQIHTLWIEPISAKLRPTEERRPKPTAIPQAPEQELTATQLKDRFVFESAIKIRELKELLAEKIRQIEEMRFGGVGSAPPLPSPDGEILLDAFEERILELKGQIHQLATQMNLLENPPGQRLQDIAILNDKLQESTRRIEAWKGKLRILQDELEKMD